MAVMAMAEGRPVFPVEVTMRGLRGPLPLEPAHPDHWLGGPRLQLVDRAPYVFERYSDTISIYWRTGNDLGCYYDLVEPETAFFGRGLYASLGTSPRLVPQATQWLNLTATFNRASGTAGLFTYSWDLWYKPGNLPPTIFSPTQGVHTRAPPPSVSEDGKGFEWRLRLEDSQADHVYAKKSVWHFVLTPTDYAAACTDVYTQPTTPPSLVWSLEASR